ncbi:hypothetical protein CCHL11_07529 [Colletotrichum chlorophyti]|uniref:CFEM domain-containing protein n=1 Tax=Colletotrichum chlorophyti TaxID=708187 RepID=A0A1Q8RZG0_9PEZI|nr:hypothetical protein CCHL11_07529 [Colletotrichum chlorophyti]
MTFAANAEDANSTSTVVQLATPPTCAMPCFIEGFRSGNCTVTNFKDCMCTNIALQTSMSACVQTSCEFGDQVETAKISQNTCRGYPVPERRKFSKIFSILLPSITTTIVFLRCVARIQITHKLWWDDWTAAVALQNGDMLTGINLSVADLGFGLHYWDIDPSNGQKILQIFYAMQMLYIFVQIVAKVSICCFYTRVFIDQRFRRVAKVFIIFLLTHACVFLLLMVFQCLPIQAIWDKEIKGRCLSVTDISYGGAAFSIFDDIILIIMPIPELMKLQLGRKKKFALAFMFAIGSFACVASMVRLQYLISFAQTYDATWDYIDIVIWSSVELNLAIMCGSLPALRPLFRTFPDFWSTVRETEQSGYQRQSRNPSVTIKSARSRNSNAHAFHAASPRQLIQPRPFGSASTNEDVHEMRETATILGTGSSDDLKEKDWMVGKQAS